MPKRVVHGEGVWRSEKLARVEPPASRAEYANLIPLALANGVFECNVKRVWSDVYAFNRPDMTPESVKALLDELERVKLLFRWQEPDGKMWGYWVGIEKPGRLPGKSRRGKNEAIGPEPPQDELRKFLDSNGFHRALNGNEKLLGFGSGSGTSVSKEQKPRIRSSKKQLEPEGFSEFWKVWPNKVAKQEAVEAFRKVDPDAELLATILHSLKIQKSSRDQMKREKQWTPEWPYPATWLNGKRWEDEIGPNGQGPASDSLTQEELVRLTEGKHERQSATA